DRRRWNDRVARALCAHLWLLHGRPMTGEGVHFVVYAGAAYRAAVEHACAHYCRSATWPAPLAGMGIGQQLQALTALSHLARPN
ncbi:MAG TPA: hypothetical protein VEZ12_21625, partial [Herpetosiphonaceae bacterium]|nr:hypothetical protein [Herpetosiphonaceae bacterium]